VQIKLTSDGLFGVSYKVLSRGNLGSDFALCQGSGYVYLPQGIKKHRQDVIAFANLITKVSLQDQLDYSVRSPLHHFLLPLATNRSNNLLHSIKEIDQ
jgi:hypothetical protein